MSEGPDHSQDPGAQDHSVPTATLLWDRQGHLPLSRLITENTYVLILTPGVDPQGTNSDPFDPLGKSLLEKRWTGLHQAAYAKDIGLTGYHVSLIKKADVLIFPITSFPIGDEVSQPDIACAISDTFGSLPLIVVLCGTVEAERVQSLGFQTVAHIPDYTPPSLQRMAHLLFDGPAGRGSLSLSPTQPRSSPASVTNWSVQPFDHERDMEDLYSMWLENTPPRFHLSPAIFESLAQRRGYSMHFVVRNPVRGGMIGFCMSFTTFLSSQEDRLVGSVAALAVKAEFRGRGIGQALHDTALRELRMIKGVRYLQLGTTFPRLLHGLPPDHPDLAWFQSQGWTLDHSSPGAGRLMADWALRFADSPPMNLASAGLSFRPCDMVDSVKVMEMVAKESESKHSFGWFDQYARTADSHLIGDILLGFEGTTMVASAIVYVPGAGSPVASDIPWPATIGPGIGGISCICIKDGDPEMVNRRDTVLVRLLNACCSSLAARGMTGAFVDGLKANESGLEQLGFLRWAQYRESWRNT